MLQWMMNSMENEDEMKTAGFVNIWLIICFSSSFPALSLLASKWSIICLMKFFFFFFQLYLFLRANGVAMDQIFQWVADQLDIPFNPPMAKG